MCKMLNMIFKQHYYFQECDLVDQRLFRWIVVLSCASRIILDKSQKQDGISGVLTIDWKHYALFTFINLLQAKFKKDLIHPMSLFGTVVEQLFYLF